MFEKTLTDVVKGIRASKRDTALYISQCIAEIRTEINSSDMYVKANALQKLTFLQMMGYSMSWASFASIEVMSSPRFAHKRIGYLAASQGFTQDTEVVLLTTNLLKKELRGAVGGGMHGVYEAGLAINCISNIVTEDLAGDLLPELTVLTTHPQPYLRKKAILCLFKVFVKYPQGLRLTFGKLQQCLSDSNASVVSCAVNVITELSDKNPKNYLHLAPAFFDLLTQSSNNWMLIKVVKLLGSLVPEEPRLARKLLDPLAGIVKNTQAKSLLYEAVHTITLCLPFCRKSDGSMPANVPDIVVLCAQVLRSFVEEPDQNLKYLGLVGFGSLMQSHPRILSAPDYRPLILACLSDHDVTIRTRALDLLNGMASQKNLIELVTQLLKHVENASGSYKQDLVAKIIEMCSGDKYSLLRDFAWYLDVLLQLGHTRGIEKHADLLRSQIVDVALRVLPVRAYAVRKSIEVILEGDCREIAHDDDVGSNTHGDNGRGKHLIPELLPGAAWIVGEYSDLIQEAFTIEDDDDTELALNARNHGLYHSVVQALTSPKQVQALSTKTQKVYLQSAMKVLAAALVDSKCMTQEKEACIAALSQTLVSYMQSIDAEVLERATTAHELMKSFTKVNGGANLQHSPFSELDHHSDLLGLHDGSNGTTISQAPPEGLKQELSDVSGIVNYLLKPSPMKPVGIKAQRKKCISPSGATFDLTAAFDMSLVGDVLTEEEETQARSKLKLDCVSFTEQRLRAVGEPAGAAVTLSQLDIFASGSAPHQIAPPSFQKPDGTPSASSGGRRKQGDPFYLDSAPSHVQGLAEPHANSRFGTIQLVDSDDEQASGEKRQKKKKREKKSQFKKDDTNLLTFGGTGSEPVGTVYGSDDEDEADVYRSNGPSTFGARRKGNNKEFEGLAKVDLTTPLRDDEVMPERRHHVVPRQPTLAPNLDTKSKKNSKKEKKKRTRKDASESVGDLLGLGGFDPIQASHLTKAEHVNAPSAAAAINPINAAFDDLLGLSTPSADSQAVASLLPQSVPINAEMKTFEPPRVSAGKNSVSSKRHCWLLATLKHSSASGLYWQQTRLLYRVHRTSKGEGLAAKVSFMFENRSAYAITDVTVDINNHMTSVLGTVAAGSSLEAPGRVGPISYSRVDCAQECRGRLATSGSEIRFKLSLPASAFLVPEPNLSLDAVSQELLSGSWSSHSGKVELSASSTVDSVKAAICSFLHAEAVDSGYGDPAVATFAALSQSSGARVRALVKIKDRIVRVDIRCTSSDLGESLASDVKRLCL